MLLAVLAIVSASSLAAEHGAKWSYSPLGDDYKTVNVVMQSSIRADTDDLGINISKGKDTKYKGDIYLSDEYERGSCNVTKCKVTLSAKGKPSKSFDIKPIPEGGDYGWTLKGDAKGFAEYFGANKIVKMSYPVDNTVKKKTFTQVNTFDIMGLDFKTYNKKYKVVLDY